MTSVNIKQGKLTGGKSTTDNGFEYFEFLEIPYAKPPVGDLRFKSPQLPKSWKGERIATESSNIASQMDLRTGAVVGTEDCLYLNVYTPKLSSSGSELLPVMVYIHGGGFAYGNGTNKEESGPDHIIEHNVVFVSINYRVNVFGFLSLDIPEAAGNMGLKDQVMALKWIQNNIEQFGGDKDNVTVFGISAGSASIEYLMLSPSANGLFQKAILQSGSSLNHWAANYEHKLLAYKLAKELGFKGVKIDYRGIHNFMLKQSAESIQISFHKVLESVKHRIFFGFVPCVEKDFGDNEAIITENPYNLMKQGKINKVTVLRGFCDTEGLLTALIKPLVLKELVESKDFLQHWPYSIDNNLNERLEVAYNIKSNRNNDDEKDKFAIEFFNDYDFVSGIWIAGKFMTNCGIIVYMYEFSYNGEINYIKSIFNIQRKGCCHGDDISYVLKCPIKAISESDKMVINTFTTLWTNFAKSGDPTPQTTEILVLKWPRFTAENMTYLNIDKELTLKSNYEPKKIEIYEEIYDKYKM